MHDVERYVKGVDLATTPPARKKTTAIRDRPIHPRNGASGRLCRSLVSAREFSIFYRLLKSFGESPTKINDCRESGITEAAGPNENARLENPHSENGLAPALANFKQVGPLFGAVHTGPRRHD